MYPLKSGRVNSFRWFLGATLLVMFWAGVPLGQDRRLREVKVDSGLFGFLPGQTVVVSLAETDDASPEAEALIRLLDSGENILREQRGMFDFGSPLFLQVQRDELPFVGDRLAVRVQVIVQHARNNELGGAIVSVEVEDPSAGESYISNFCPVPSGPDGGKSGPILFSCGPCKCEVRNTLLPPA